MNRKKIFFFVIWFLKDSCFYTYQIWLLFFTSINVCSSTDPKFICLTTLRLFLYQYNVCPSINVCLKLALLYIVDKNTLISALNYIFIYNSVIGKRLIRCIITK